MLRLLKNNTDNINYHSNIQINQLHDLYTKSQSISKYIENETEKSLNQNLLEDKDLEYVSFKPKYAFTIKANFQNYSDYASIGVINLAYAKEAYYIFDVYDSFLDTNQKLLSRNYVKLYKILSSFTDTSIYFDDKILAKEYRNLYIPSYYMNSDIDKFYLKISFFNPGNGTLRFFQCYDYLIDSSKNYFEVTIDKTDKTYYIDLFTFSYSMTEIIQTQAEKSQVNKNSINKLLPPKPKQKVTITSKGTII
jgi:hypothetical protein